MNSKTHVRNPEIKLQQSSNFASYKNEGSMKLQQAAVQIHAVS